MEKALVVVVVLTLMEEVISCESPLLNAVVIAGMVLLMVGVWSDLSAGTSDAGAEDPQMVGHGPRPTTVGAEASERTRAGTLHGHVPSSAMMDKLKKIQP